MFALNIPSTFGDTIDCRINGKPKRVTWRDEHTLVIEADPYCDCSGRHRQVRRQLDRLRSARQPGARLHGKGNFETRKRGCRIQKSPKSQLHLKIARRSSRVAKRNCDHSACSVGSPLWLVRKLDEARPKLV